MRGMRRPPHAYVRARCAGGASVVASTGRGCAVFSFSHASAMSNASRVGGGASSAWPCRGPSRGRRGSRSWAGARRARRRRVSQTFCTSHLGAAASRSARRRPPAPHTHNRRRSDRSFGNRPGDPGGGGVGDVGFEASTYFRCKLAYDIDGTMTRVAQLNLPDCTVRKVNLEDQSVLLGTVQADCLEALPKIFNFTCPCPPFSLLKHDKPVNVPLDLWNHSLMAVRILEMLLQLPHASSALIRSSCFCWSSACTCSIAFCRSRFISA